MPSKLCDKPGGITHCCHQRSSPLLETPRDRSLIACHQSLKATWQTPTLVVIVPLVPIDILKLRSMAGAAPSAKSRSALPRLTNGRTASRPSEHPPRAIASPG